MIKRIAASALVTMLGCSGMQIDRGDDFNKIADTRDSLAKGVHPAQKQMDTRWRYSIMLHDAVRWYQSGRSNKNNSDPFNFVIQYCRMSNENLRNAENVCATTDVCDNLYLIRHLNRETQDTCRKFVRSYI